MIMLNRNLDLYRLTCSILQLIIFFFPYHSHYLVKSNRPSLSTIPACPHLPLLLSMFSKEFQEFVILARRVTCVPVDKFNRSTPLKYGCGTVLGITLPETNIFAPENGWLEDEFPFGMAHLQVRTVSFREGITL